MKPHASLFSSQTQNGTACLAAVFLLVNAFAPARGAAAENLVRGIQVQPEHAPDCSSLKAIAESVTRGATNNDAKAIAIYNFMQLTHYHRDYPNEPGGVPVLKAINSYGWGLCGGLHATESALWRELGWGWRFVGWDGHTTVETEYDGRWHYLDIFLKFYAWMPDGKGGFTLAGERDLKANSQVLITDAFELDRSRGVVYVRGQAESKGWRAPSFLSCGDTISGVVSGLATQKRAGSPEGWAPIFHASGNYSAEVNLAPGFSLENSWEPQPDSWSWYPGAKIAPAHTCSGHKDTRNDPAAGLVLEPYIHDRDARSYANGTLTFAPDFSGPAALQGFSEIVNAKASGGALVPIAPGQPASVTVRLASPYVLTRCTAEATGADAVEVSVDEGKTFQAATLPMIPVAMNGRVAALVRVKFHDALRSLRLVATVQNNPGALPYLSPGSNRVAVSVAEPAALGANELVVTYAYRLGSRTKSIEALFNDGKEIARQHNANWSDTVTFVQRRFSAKDLPATLTIDCPTLKGNHPVYPHMVMLRREIVAPGGATLPLPKGAVAARPVAANEELAELPNPFLVTATPPVPVVVAPVNTTRIPLSYVQFVDDKGASADSGILRWPKTVQEQGKVLASAVMLSGDFKTVPKKGIVAARLVIPIRQAHNMAATQIGAVLLRKPVVRDTAWDAKSLTEIVGTATLPPQNPDKPYNPAKRFTIDVTRAVKLIAGGETAHGFALRVVPDRAVDDGHTVRCEVSSADPISLEIDTRIEGAAPESPANAPK